MLKFIWGFKGPEIAKISLKRTTELENLHHLILCFNYEYRVNIRTNRQRNRDSEIDSHLYRHWNFYKRTNVGGLVLDA